MNLVSSTTPSFQLHFPHSSPLLHLLQARMYPQQSWLWSMDSFRFEGGGQPQIAHPPCWVLRVSWYHCSVVPNRLNLFFTDCSRIRGLLFLAHSLLLRIASADLPGRLRYSAHRNLFFGSIRFLSLAAATASGWFCSHLFLFLRSQSLHCDFNPHFIARFGLKLAIGWGIPAKWQSFFEHSLVESEYNETDERVMQDSPPVRSWPDA